jgi:calcium-dependent protein kinase
MYIVICGSPPFDGNSDDEILQRVAKGVYSLADESWQDVSAEAKTLVGNLLCLDPNKRFNSEQAVHDNWVKHKAPHSNNVAISKSLLGNMRAFKSKNKLKMAAIHVIADQLDDLNIKGLREIFKSLDSNDDGTLTAKELQEGMAKAGGAIQESAADLLKLFASLDTDGSGNIDYSEFLAASLDRKLYEQQNACWAAFHVFDRNGDGKISKEELAQVLENGNVQQMMGAKAIESLMGSVDTNGDGFISFEEFMDMMRKD